MRKIGHKNYRYQNRVDTRVYKTVEGKKAFEEPRIRKRHGERERENVMCALYNMLCYVMLCYVILYYIILYITEK
jgi:hypothetical protein